MPTHKSAEKRLKTSQKANLRNRLMKSKIKTLIKRVEDIDDPQKGAQELKNLVSLLDKASRLNVIHKNAVARTKSRLTKLVNQKSQAQTQAQT